jgi:hypothetical protein
MNPVLTAAVVLALTTGAALAQTDPMTGARPGNTPGTGQSLPVSNNASNITPSDSRSLIAPRLPAPSLGESASPRDFLVAARNALGQNRTGEAQEALERAESRALNRSVLPSSAGNPSGQPLVQTIADARRALSQRDHANVVALIDQAIANPESAGTMQ